MSSPPAPPARRPGGKSGVELLTDLEEREGGGESGRACSWEQAGRMNLDPEGRAARCPARGVVPVRTRRVRDKRMAGSREGLPGLRIDPAKEYAAGAVISQAMKVFAARSGWSSVDADLGSTSGLEAGVGGRSGQRGQRRRRRGQHDVHGRGLRRAGLQCLDLHLLPFLRPSGPSAHRHRPAGAAGGHGGGAWLSEGHGLDLTFLATAANFDTRTNGATHMGNDDVLLFAQIAHLKIIDFSCPNQLLAS